MEAAALEASAAAQKLQGMRLSLLSAVTVAGHSAAFAALCCQLPLHSASSSALRQPAVLLFLELRVLPGAPSLLH